MQLFRSYQINGKIMDICIIGGFTVFQLAFVAKLGCTDFIAWDLSVPYHDASDTLKWTFRPYDLISPGGEWILPPYATFVQALLTFATNNLLAAKLMTLFPIPLSFIFFYYSTRKLTLGRLSSIAGASFMPSVPFRLHYCLALDSNGFTRFCLSF